MANATIRTQTREMNTRATADRFVEARNIVHVCDSLAETIVLFDRDGNLITRWYLRELLGEVSEPEDIVIDASGEHIYIGEVRNHRVHYLRARSAP